MYSPGFFWGENQSRLGFPNPIFSEDPVPPQVQKCNFNCNPTGRSKVKSEKPPAYSQNSRFGEVEIKMPSPVHKTCMFPDCLHPHALPALYRTRLSPPVAKRARKSVCFCPQCITHGNSRFSGAEMLNLGPRHKSWVFPGCLHQDALPALYGTRLSPTVTK